MIFSKEAKSLLTPFRAEALETIYKAAKSELGMSMRSAYVFMWDDPEESNEVFVLRMLAKADREKLKGVFKSILDAVADKSAHWTELQKKDYSEKIYFELDPVDG
jgi:hypothetical protein